MVSKFQPILNKVYFINKYSLFHIMEGTGIIQVDFKNYFDWDDKLIFLEKGQYIKFLSDEFVVRQITFEDEQTFKQKEVRVLFKHLVSVGYINYQECEDCQLYLKDTLYSNSNSILDVSINQWYWQNPFNADQSEYQIIFDLKEIIDREFKNDLAVPDLVRLVNKNDRTIHHLVKNKVGVTVKNLFLAKRIIESKKEIDYSGKNIDTIAYEMGYKDPAYFNRIFKQKTGITPGNFREQMGFEITDHFEQEIYELLKE
ncbi:MAG: AraC family transcriptional regulator, partial [Bacteroidota bacterium]